MEMDFRSMKRKELQAHCKKHGLPANLTNSQMAESLESLLLSQEKVKVKLKGCLKGSGGSGGASKKVSFTLDEEEKLDLVRNSGRRKRRSSVAVAAEVVPESDVPARPRTRSLAKAVVWSPVVGKKARRSTESVRANDESIQVINLSSDDEKMEEEKVPATRALRSRIVGVCEGEEVKMAEKKAAVEVTATRTLRDRVVAAGEDEGTKREKKPAGEVPATQLLRNRDVVAGEGETIQNDMDDAKKTEKKPSEKVPVTRSLRSRAVVAVEVEKTQMDIEPRQTRKRARAVEGADDEKVPKANLNGDGEEDARKAEKKSEAPAARSLRNRTVVVGGDKAMVGDIEPRKTRRSQKAAKGVEAEEAKPGEREGAEKKDMKKQTDDVVSAVLVLSVDDSQKDVPPKEAPVRRTRRMVSKPETSQSEVEMHLAVEARTEADGGNVRDEGITVRRKKTRKQGDIIAFELDSESLTEVAPSQALTELPRKSRRGSSRNEPLSDELVIGDKTVNDKKAGRRARRAVEEDKAEGKTRKQPVASKAKKSSAPKSDSATELETIEVHKGTCRAVSSDESRHNANDHNLSSVEDGKSEDGDMAAGENKFGPRQRGTRRQRILRKAKEIPAPENETAKELEAVDVQDEAQRAILNEDPPRKSGQNAPGLNVPVPLDRIPDDVDMIIGETECVEASPKLNEMSNRKRKHENSNAEVGACAYLVEKVTEVQQPVLTDDFSGSPCQNDQLKRSGSDKSPVLSLQNGDVSLVSPFYGKSSGNIEIAQSHIKASVVKAVERVLEVTGYENLNVEVDVLPGRMNEAESEGIMDADNISNLQYTTLKLEVGAQAMTEVLNAESTKSRLVPDIEEVAQETNHEDVIVSANSYGAKETALNINSSSPIPTSCHQDETDGRLAVHEAKDIIDLRQSLSHSEEYSPSKIKEATLVTDHELVTVPANSSFLPHQTSFPQDKTDGVLAGHEETVIIGAPVSLSHSNELSPSEFKESTKETDDVLVAAHTNSSGLPIQTSCHQDKTDGHLAGHETTNTISVPLSFSLNDELPPSDIKEASQETDLELVTAPANSSGFPIQMSFFQDKTDGLLTGQETANFIGLPLSFTNKVLSPSDVKEATQEINFELFTAHANSSVSPIPTSCKLDETDGLLVNVSCNSDFAEVSFKSEDETTLTHVNLLSEGNDGVGIGGAQNDEENTRDDVAEPFQSAEGISNDAIFETGSGSYCNAKDSNILEMPVEDIGHSNLKFSDINDETTEHVLTDMEHENVRELVEDFKGNSPLSDCIKSVQEETAENSIKFPVPELVHGFSIVEIASLESPRCSDDDSDIGVGDQDAITVVMDNTPDNDMAPQIVSLEIADAEPCKYVMNEATSEISEDVSIVDKTNNAEDFQDSKDNLPSRSDCVGTPEQVVVLEVTEHYSKTSLESVGCSTFNSDVAEGVKDKPDNDIEDQIATMEDVDVEPHKSTTDGGDGCFINTPHHDYGNSNPEVTNITGVFFSSLHSEDVSTLAYGEVDSEKFADVTNENGSHGSDPSHIISDENPDDFTQDSVNLRSASIDEEQTCQETPHATRVHVDSEIKESNTVGCNSHFSENLSGEPRECFVSPSLLFGTMNDDLGSDKGKNDQGTNNCDVVHSVCTENLASDHCFDDIEGGHGKTSLKDSVICGSDHLASGSWCSPDHFNSTDATFKAQSVGHSAMIASAVSKDSPNLNTNSIELAALCQMPQIPLSVVDIAQDNCGHAHFKSNSEGTTNCLDDDSPSEGESGAALAELFSEDYKYNSSSPTANTPEELSKFQKGSCPQTDKQCTASNIPICEQGENTTVVRGDSGENNNLSDVKKLPDSAEKHSVVSKFSDPKGMPDEIEGLIASNFKTNSRGFKCFDDSSLYVGDSGAAMTRLFSEDYGVGLASPIANTPEVEKNQKAICPQTDKKTPASIIAFREQRENITVCEASSENYGSCDLRKIPDSVEGLSVVSKFSDLKGMIFESGGSIPSPFKGNSEKHSCLDDDSLSAGDSKDALAGLFCEDYKHPSASRFAYTCPKSLDDDSLASGDSGAALEGLFSEDYNHPSVSPIANTPEQVAKFQKFNCLQMNTQFPATMIALPEQGENFTVVLDASTADHNTSCGSIAPDCIEELPAVGMGDKSPANNNEKSTVSLEARDDGNNGHSRVKSPCSLYGLNEGFSVEQLGDSIIRGSKEVSLGLSSSQTKLEPPMDQDMHKEILVCNFDSPCYQYPQAFSVARDRQLCEDGSSRLEVTNAPSPAEKDLKVSLDERPFSLSTSLANTVDYAEVTLGMSSSHKKFEAFQVHDKHKEDQVDTFDPESCSELHLALPVATDTPLYEVGYSPLEGKHAINLAEQDSNVSFNESPFSLSIFKQSAEDVEVKGSDFCTSTTTATQDFNFEFKTNRQQGHSEQGITDDSNGNLSTVLEFESLGKKEDTIFLDEFVGEPAKGLCSPLSIKRSSDGVYITPTIVTSTLNVTDSKGFPGQESTMPIGSSFSAEKLDYENSTDFWSKDTNILTGGSTYLQSDAVDEAGARQEMGDLENVIGLKELFSPEHKVNYSSSSFLANEKATAFSEASSPMLNPDQESEMPTLLKTPGRDMAVDANDTSHIRTPGLSDEMTEEFLTKSPSVSKYVVRISEKVSEQSLNPEQKVDELEAVQETEDAYVDIRTSQLYGSPLCRPFSESVDSRLNAVDTNFLKGTDDHQGNDDDVLSLEGSSFALNIFENEDSVYGDDSGSSDHSQDTIWERLEETESVAVVDEMEHKIVNDMKSTAVPEQQANNPSDGIAEKVEMTMHTNELDRKVTCGADLISNRVDNLGGKIHGAALTSSSLFQTPDPQGSSTRREINIFEDIASAKKPESGLGTSGILLAELQNLEKSNADDASVHEVLDSHKISSSPKNFRPLGCSDMNIIGMGGTSDNFTDQVVDGDVSISLCDTLDQNILEDHEVFEKETKNIMDVESNLGYHVQVDEQKEIEPFLVVCDDIVPEAAALSKTNDALLMVASGCDMKDDDRELSDKGIDGNLEEDYVCNNLEPVCENSVESSETIIFANAEIARIGEEITHEGTDCCPVLPTIDCSPIPSKLDCDEIKESSGSDTMNEINKRLTNFRITTARKLGRIQSTPLKQVKSLKFESAIDMLKDKENMSVMKTDRPPQSNIEKTVKASSVRRPLQRVEKSNTAGQ